MVIVNDCQSIYATSDLIDEFVDAFPTPSFKLILRQDCCCNGSFVSTEIAPDQIETTTGINKLPLSLATGLHNLQLVKETTTSNTTESLCFFNECGLECKIVELVAEGNHDAWKFFEALRLVNVCDSCTCEKACVIWQELSKILNQPICAS
jgi:hypothetical protein